MFSRALLLLSLLAAGSNVTSHGNDFFAQRNQFRIAAALCKKSGLDELALRAGALEGTFFFPTDAAAVEAFAPYLPSGEETSVEDVLDAVESAESETVLAFLQHHMTERTYTTTTDLLAAGSVGTRAQGRLQVMEGGDRVGLVYRESARNVWPASVALGITIPRGRSAVYALNEGVLASPAIITGWRPKADA